jgi:hypothetical protein
MLETTIELDEISDWLDRLEKAAVKAPLVAMQRLQVRGEEHALRLLNQLIYMTPERGGYRRTGNLRANFRVFAVQERGEARLYMVNTTPGYPPHVEQGTYDNKLEPDDIISLAEGIPGEVILMDFGDAQGKGMEPRPSFYPTWVKLARELPGEVMTALVEEIEKA